MINELKMCEFIKQQLTADVWNLIAEELGDTIPSLVNAAIENKFPNLLEGEEADELHRQIAISLGPLAFE